MTKKNFEQSLAQLEKIVQELEAGNLPLEKAIRKFEQGIQLSKFCGQKLNETEKRINLLIQNDAGELTQGPFEPDPDA